MKIKTTLFLATITFCFLGVSSNTAFAIDPPYQCEYAEKNHKCGNYRNHIILHSQYSMTNALNSCANYAAANNKDFCYVLGYSNEASQCTSTGRKWIAASNCCVNYECQIGQYGVGPVPGTGGCAPCTNKPAYAVSVTYSSSGCAANQCNYATVTCEPGRYWNGTACAIASPCQIHLMYTPGSCQVGSSTYFLGSFKGGSGNYKKYYCYNGVATYTGTFQYYSGPTTFCN